MFNSSGYWSIMKNVNIISTVVCTYKFEKTFDNVVPWIPIEIPPINEYLPHNVIREREDYDDIHPNKLGSD